MCMTFQIYNINICTFYLSRFGVAHLHLNYIVHVALLLINQKNQPHYQLPSVIPALIPLGVVPTYEPDSALCSLDGHAYRTDRKNILPRRTFHSSRLLDIIVTHNLLATLLPQFTMFSL